MLFWFRHESKPILPAVCFALAVSCNLEPLSAQQVRRSSHGRTSSDIAAQTIGLRVLIDALFPETADWSNPDAWPRLNRQQAVSIAAALTEGSNDESSLYGSLGPLDGRIFSLAWNTCEPRFGCLRQSHDASGDDLISYAGGAPDAEGEWSALWSKLPQDRWRRFAFPGRIERVHLTAKPDVIVYQDDFHEGGTYLALLTSNGGWLPNRYAALVFVPTELDLRNFKPVHEPDIVRPTRPCLLDRPGFADAAASNCEPLDSLADYTGLPWAASNAPALDRGHFVKRVKILGRASAAALSDWRFVSLGFQHIDARNAVPRVLSHHLPSGPGKRAVKPEAETHLDYAAGWVNLRNDPSSHSGWSFSGRP